MEKLIQLTKFDGGILDNFDRNLPDGYLAYAENVEFKKTSAKQLLNTAEIAAANAYNITKVIKVGDDIYGYGHDNASDDDVTIYKIDTSSTVTSAEPATGYVQSGKADPFLLYNADGYLYFENGNKIGRMTTAFGSVNGDWSNMTGGLSGGLNWQGSMYGWLNQDIWKVVATDCVNMLAIPAGQTIKKLLDLGNYMGIVCSGSDGDSKMYLWDGVTETFADIIKIGSGYVIGAEILDGVVYVVVNSYNYKKLRIKEYDGSTFKTVYEYKGRRNISSPTTYHITAGTKTTKQDGYIYILISGTRPQGTDVLEYYIARYGRDDISKQNAFSIVKTIGATANTQWPAVFSSFVVQNDNSNTSIPFFATLFDSTDNMDLFRTSTSTYSGQAGVIETGWYDGGYANKKVFKGFMCQFEALPAGASVVLKYMKDAETTWTTLFTEATDNEVQRELIKDIPAKQIKFRIELLGGAELTGFLAKYETQASKLL